MAGIISAAVWFAIFFVAHLTAFHARPRALRSKLILRLYALAVAGHVLGLVILSSITQSRLEDLSSNFWLPVICGVLLLLCLFVLYMPFYYTINTSLSVETLAILEMAERQRVPIKSIEHRFASPDFVRDRLETMESNGYLESLGEDKWRITARGLRVAEFMRYVKDTLRLGAGG